MPVTEQHPAELFSAHLADPDLTGPGSPAGGWEPAAAWARPSAYSADRSARRAYLLTAAHHPDFPARAGRTALRLGRRLGAPTDDRAVAVGLAHLATHIAALDLAARLAAFPDDATLPGLLDDTIRCLWPEPGRAARPGHQAHDAGHRLRAHLEALGYLTGSGLLTRTADQLTGLAGCQGHGAPAWAGALVGGMLQHWTEECPGIPVPERTDLIHRAAVPALLP
ncbi:hypothetical protein [Kitasatospora sp. NPDC059327]|uniref:hypothetical protein n=1 Tax=Kitasatospora sp. NPDC059327 TaxID=3346803 RepID=UPI003680B797